MSYDSMRGLLAELQKCAEGRCEECKDANCEHIGCKDARLFMAIDAIKELLTRIEEVKR